MKYKIVQISTISAFGVLASLSAVSPQIVSAEQIVIESNGSGSSNEVNVTVQSETTVEQTNNVEITNNVDASANTGNNEANNNTGENTTIETGDAEVNVDITNVGNSNTVNQDCCTAQTPGTVSISGNGAGSVNNTNITNTYQTNVSIANNASVTNNVNGKAVTGKNSANGNLGDVAIKTGNITASESIHNGPFNVNSVSVSTPANGSFSISIKNNGADSENKVVLNDTVENSVTITNSFDVINESDWELVTGKNSADGNLGDVFIGTGNISFESSITNEGNINVVEVTCCPDEPDKPEEPKTPPTNPPGGNNGGNNGGSSGGGNGSSGSGDGRGGPGAVLGEMLPATGGGFFFIFLLTNTLFLLFGLFMRLRAGRSPGLALSI